MTIQTQFFPLQGGLDLVTPPIQTPAGRVIAALNYEGHPRGYQRMDGFERLDGRPKPSEASYWVLRFENGDTPIQADDVVEGGTSTATGIALIDAVLESGDYGSGDAAGYLVLINVTGDFLDAEALEVSAVAVATADGTLSERGASNDTDDATWLQAAIEYRRSLIAAVPGSGPVRGVWVYDGDVYAFRDNSGGTAGVMHKATASGWATVPLGREIAFELGTVEFTEGQTVTGGSSSATATIERVVLEQGVWTDEVWQEVGNRLAITYAVPSGLCALNPTTVVLANATADVLQAYQWDGEDWEAVGSTGPISGAGNSAITALNGTDVAFIDGNNDALRAYRWDGSSFTQLGNSLSISTVSGPALAALNETDVAFIDATNDELRTYRFDGTDWTLLGSGLAISTVGTPALTALNETDVAFIDATNAELRTYRFNGSTWALVGTGLSVAGIGDPALAALDEETVLMADGTTDKLRAFRWTGATWREVVTGIDIGPASSPVLAALNSTDVAFLDPASDQLRVYRFNSTGLAQGRLILSGVAGAFVANEVLTDGAGGAAVADAPDSAITLPPGGRYDFRNYNFFGSSDLMRMYGVNGVGRGFEFDGSVLVPINTGMVDDKPTRVEVHRNHLFYAFAGGSLQHSSTGDPYQWQVLTGAGEIGIGEEITDLLASLSGVLAVFGRNNINLLYGDDAANWEMRTLADDSGAVAWTAQKIGTPIYLDSRGLRSLSTTDAFGDFRIGTVTQLVEPIFQTKRKRGVTAVGSLRVRAKDQYRLFFSDGTGLTVYFGRSPAEILPFDLGFAITCAASGKDDDGEEVLLVGSEDGWVYELDAGTSFDGEEVEAFLRLPFNHVGSPSQRKRWTKATLEIDGGPQTTLGLTAEFGYADPDQPPSQQQVFDVRGGGGFWNEMEWDNFYWSSPVHGMAEAPIDGLGRNLSIAVASRATYEQPHVLHGLVLHFSYRGLVR